MFKLESEKGKNSSPLYWWNSGTLNPPTWRDLLSTWPWPWKSTSGGIRVLAKPEKFMTWGRKHTQRGADVALTSLSDMNVELYKNSREYVCNETIYWMQTVAGELEERESVDGVAASLASVSLTSVAAVPSAGLLKCQSAGKRGHSRELKDVKEVAGLV